MLETINLSNNVIKIISDSNCYIIGGKIIIDTSSKQYNYELKETINEIINPEEVEKVIFTHLHYDHIGNFKLFPNAKFYAYLDSSDFSKNKLNYILDPITSEQFNPEIKDIINNKELNKMFDIIKTPGHCKTCIIIYYKKDNILFTGDTYFHKYSHGRVDLPTSEPDKIKTSLKKTNEYIEKYHPTIAPGHDY
jgi:hydroxyacylglutathione hydrolase